MIDRVPSRLAQLLVSCLWLAASLLATPASADVDFANRTGSGPIKATHSGLCLTVPGGSTAQGTQLDQELCNGSAAQVWQVKAVGTTHTVDNDQRRVPLTISGANGTQYNLTLPSDPGIVTPGNWMLFALDNNGVPSVAKIVRIR